VIELKYKKALERIEGVCATYPESNLDVVKMVAVINRIAGEALHGKTRAKNTGLKSNLRFISDNTCEAHGQFNCRECYPAKRRGGKGGK
jgi:hypothetical protein